LNADHSSLRSAHLVKNYGRRRVVDDVSLQVDKGEVVGLLGANGAGKTTTFYMIVGLERPDAGSVLLGDQDLTKLPMYLRARLGIGYLPQEPSVFRKMTTALKSCSKNSASRMCEIPAATLCQVANAGALK
jgi:lipopolysaccharide export system ATP-binding protein